MIDYTQRSSAYSLGFREAAVESAAMAWLEVVGWRTLDGTYLAPDGPGAPRGSYADVVLLSRLEDALFKLNPDVGSDGITAALRKIQDVESQDLLDQNRRMMRLMRDGVDVETNHPEHGVITRKVRLFDLERPERNDFLAANQFTVVEGKEHRRLDIACFVNGLPLAIVELKDAVNSDATLLRAFNQIQTYKTSIPTFFRHNGAIVISDGMEARIG